MHEKHRQRVRERYLKSGLTGFADHEVLEFLLFFSIPRVNTNETAHALLEHFGSLDAVLSAHVEDLAQVKGIGMHSAILLSLIKPIGLRCMLQQGIEKKHLRTYEDAGVLCATLLRDQKNEVLYLICLDSNFRVLHHCPLQEGSVSNLQVYPRQIVQICLRYNASNIILAHNHPGGHPSPSHTDISTTRRILEAVTPLEITLLDHFIIADGRYYSFMSSVAPVEPAFSQPRMLTAAERKDLGPKP